MSPLRLLLASALCLSLVAGREGANHLVGPGALSTYGGGGGRRRAASYVRVQDPAAGFFVGGSSNEGVNGLYARTERLPASLKGTQRRFSLLYVHMDSGWHLGFVESADDARASEMEWVFIDAAGRDRMFLSENTLIPAAGERWSKASREPERRRSRWTPSSWSWYPSAADEEPASEETRVEAAPRLGTDANDVDELPWQLIAVLSDDMLSNLAGHKRHHDARVASALNCHPPTAPAGAESEDIAPPPRRFRTLTASRNWRKRRSIGGTTRKRRSSTPPPSRRKRRSSDAPMTDAKTRTVRVRLGRGRCSACVSRLRIVAFVVCARLARASTPRFNRTPTTPTRCSNPR